LRGEQHVDNNTLVDHAKPRCYSNEIYKGILDDRASSAFSGMLLVRPDSQETNAFQENKTILLTDEASSYSKPQLEIYADDVKCSHGATTGSVDYEALFYLRARGISEDRARNMLLHAFVNDVLELIKHEPIRKHVLAVLDERLSD
jgi:Fe-S cluster assembly protein SufD